MRKSVPAKYYLVFEALELIWALLLEANGHHEVDDGGELIQFQMVSPGARGQLAVELGGTSPI